MRYVGKLFLTRDQAVCAIRAKEPEAQLFGIPSRLLLLYEEIRWVDYLASTHLWDLTFDDEVSALLWRMTYI